MAGERQNDEIQSKTHYTGLNMKLKMIVISALMLAQVSFGAAGWRWGTTGFDGGVILKGVMFMINPSDPTEARITLDFYDPYFGQEVTAIYRDKYDANRLDDFYPFDNNAKAFLALVQSAKVSGAKINLFASDLLYRQYVSGIVCTD